MAKKKRFYSRPKTFDGKLYKAVKASGSCVGCAFHMNCDNRMFKYLGSCSPDEREDGQNIIFIEVTDIEKK